MYGGQGTVKIITYNGQKVACKHLLYGKAADEDDKHRFLREIKIAQKIDSPHVIKVLDYGEDEDGFYYIMPRYHQNLGEFIAANGSVLFNDPAMQQAIFASILSGVKALHDADIIHRDLKPGNVLMNGIDEIAICDFGFSKDVDASSSYTATGEWFGTPQYMSPEQQIDSKHVDVRTDIYALGKILNVLIGRGIAPAQPQLCEVADKASAYDKEMRYANVIEFAHEVSIAYKIWMRNNSGVEIKNLIDDISKGKISDLELTADIALVLNNQFYSSGDADSLFGNMNERQYRVLENDNLPLCMRMFELIWKDWEDSWNNVFSKIDDMTSLVQWIWRISKSSEVKGYNLAKLADIADQGHRYAAMDAMVDMIADISNDDETKRALLRYTSAYTIRDNYKHVGKRPPSWL